MKWTVSYRAVLRAPLDAPRRTDLQHQVHRLTLEQPGRIVQVPECASGTLLAGEVVVDQDGFTVVEGVLARLADLEAAWPEVIVEAEDSLGLVIRDPSTHRLAVVWTDAIVDQWSTEVAMLDAADMLLEDDPWPDDESSVGFEESFWTHFDLTTGRPVPLNEQAQTSGCWRADVRADIRETRCGDGRVISLDADLDLDCKRTDVARVIDAELVIRDAAGQVLGMTRSGMGVEVRRRTEARITHGLDADTWARARSLELWLDAWFRRRTLLGRFEVGRTFETAASGPINAHLLVRPTRWPLQGILAAGEIINRSPLQLRSVDVHIQLRSPEGRLIDDEDHRLGVLAPGETRPLSIELALERSGPHGSGTVSAQYVARGRERVWTARLHR